MDKTAILSLREISTCSDAEGTRLTDTTVERCRLALFQTLLMENIPNSLAGNIKLEAGQTH